MVLWSLELYLNVFKSSFHVTFLPGIFLRENKALDKMREGARKSSRYDEVAM